MIDEEKAMKLKAVPNVPVSYVPAQGGDKFALGKITIRVMEDGSHTNNRIGVAEFTVPAETPGPPGHWHEMHDETFLVTKGTLRFHLTDGKHVDAKAGDYVVVPTRAPHTFSNPFGEEAMFLNTFTPAYYINYFKLLSTMSVAGQPMSEEANIEAMARYATLPVRGGL